MAATRSYTRETMPRSGAGYGAPSSRMDFPYRSGDRVTVDYGYAPARNADYGYAAEAVTPSKRGKLKRTALFWLQRFGEVPARFDVLEIYDEFTPVRIHWIKNAF